MFDSLVHLTRDGSWLGGTRYDASSSRLLCEMDAASVERACLVGIAHLVENDAVHELAAEHPDRFMPIAGFDPMTVGSSGDCRAELSRLVENGFRGIKLHPRLNGYDPRESRCTDAIRCAGELGLAVFLDTLFRQRGRCVTNPVDTIDYIVSGCRDTRIVLLHSAGPAMLELFELGRMYEHILLDLSFSLLRYAGSSLDADMRFLMANLDQRVVIGSDFPEYTPREALDRFESLAATLPKYKRDAVLFGNLTTLFSECGAE